MKICHLSSFLPKYHKLWGGAEMAALRLAQAQTKAGHKVDFLIARPEQQVQEDFSVHVLATVEDYVPGLLKRFFDLLKRWFLPFDLLTFVHSYLVLKKLSPDIVHVHNVKSLSLAVVLAAKLCGLKVIFSIYDYWLFCPKETLVSRQWGVFAYLRQIFFRPFIAMVNAFLVLSESSADILKESGIGPDKIEKIHLSFDLNKFPAYGLQEVVRGRILYVGWLQPRKGLHILIRAMTDVLKHSPSASLRVIGATEDSVYLLEIKKLIKEQQLESVVKILGKVDDGCLQKELKQANVIVIPEQWPNMSPLFLIESMSYAKPVVAGRIGGLPEFIRDGENGYLFEPQAESELAAKIIKIFSDPEKARQMGEQARHDVFGLCDEKTNLAKIEALYRKVNDNVK
ncbi:glycosyltransferase family 4 protein [Candidatus Margulisiibacteriota bacterium]